MNQTGTFNNRIPAPQASLTPRRRGLLILTAALLLLGFNLGWGAQFAWWLRGPSWLLFGLLCAWGGTLLEQIWRPERTAYRRMTQLGSRLIRQEADQALLLDRLTGLLFKTLAPGHLSLWRYEPEAQLLRLLRVQEDQLTNPQFTELPLDLDPRQLATTQATTTLPESALRQGLLILEIEGLVPLVLGGELVGLLGLGWDERSAAKERLESSGGRWLDLLAGYLALVVKNACLIGDLEETISQLQLAYRRTIEAEEEERRRLAVELHDDILSRLTTMGMTLRNCQRHLHPDSLERVTGWLESLEQETANLNDRLRGITQGLHPTVLTDLGLIAALEAYMDSLAGQSLPASAPQTVTVTAQGFNGQRLPAPELERDLYYVTRQALDNAITHAGAEQVLIHLRWGAQAISVTVQDTGCGLKEEPATLMGQKGHLGLLSMQERVLAWNGHLNFDNASKGGTTVHARLPVAQASHDPTHLQAFTHYLRPSTPH